MLGENISSIIAELNERSTAIENEIKDWSKLETTLMYDHSELAKLPSPESHSILNEISALFKTILRSLQESILPPESEIREVIDRTDASLMKQFETLNAACKIAANLDLSEMERVKAKLEICHDSLHILNSEIALLNDIKSELQYAIDSEKVSETILKQLANLAILMLTNIPMPSTSFTLENEYKNFLYNEVKGDVESIVQIRAVIENELHKAESVVEVGEAPLYAKQNAQQKSPMLFQPSAPKNSTTSEKADSSDQFVHIAAPVLEEKKEEGRQGKCVML
ncbi:MAG: hypothetical protein SFW66_07205 [Gammaproteobacteria bacterium]|nr:hypothetical protein [Gammaproteobacteria bacterium]